MKYKGWPIVRRKTVEEPSLFYTGIASAAVDAGTRSTSSTLAWRHGEAAVGAAPGSKLSVGLKVMTGFGGLNLGVTLGEATP